MQTLVLSNVKHIPDGECIQLNTESFADGEISIDVSCLNFTSKSFLLVQSFFGNHKSIIELLFAIDAIRRNSSAKIHVLLNYFSYARQDRQITQTTPLSAKIIADLLSSQKIDTISIVDMHSPQIQGFFTKPCFNISLQSFFQNHITQNHLNDNPCICSADLGGAKSSRIIANTLGIDSVIIEKFRPKAGISQALSISGDVDNKTCILIDDIIDTAGTLCNAAEILKKNGAKSVIAYTTHGVFSKDAIQRIESSFFDKVYISNTIPRKNSGKIIQLDAWNFIINEVSQKIKNF